MEGKRANPHGRPEKGEASRAHHFKLLSRYSMLVLVGLESWQIRARVSHPLQWPWARSASRLPRSRSEGNPWWDSALLPHWDLQDGEWRLGGRTTTMAGSDMSISGLRTVLDVLRRCGWRTFAIDPPPRRTEAAAAKVSARATHDRDQSHRARGVLRITISPTRARRRRRWSSGRRTSRATSSLCTSKGHVRPGRGRFPPSSFIRRKTRRPRHARSDLGSRAARIRRHRLRLPALARREVPPYPYAWRSVADIMLPMDVTRAYPEADQDRIGALGFSEGAVLSLLMAAHDPDRIKAVVAYYPITDFPHWYAGERSGSVRTLPLRFGALATTGRLRRPQRQRVRRGCGWRRPTTWRSISAPPCCSCTERRIRWRRRRNQRAWPSVLTASGDTVQLLVVPGAGRLFNFRQSPQAALAWDATLAWLDRYLRPTPRGADAPRLGAP